MFGRLRALALFIFAISALTACGGGGSSAEVSATPPPPPAALDLEWDQGSWDQENWQ
jgi:hypothetical protein